MHEPSEGDIISNNVNTSHNNQCLVKVLKLKNKKIFEDKKSESIIYRYKMNLINNVNKGKILKKDKSVSTDNIIIRRSYLNNNDTQKIHTLFNNKLIASLTKNEKKFFLTTSNKTKDKDNNRNILVYYKSY